jgi:hypothetical protein
MERIEVQESTLSALLRLKGDWLLNEREIMIIREVQYQHVKPTQEELQEHEDTLPVNTTVFRRRKHRKQGPRDRFYITELEINGYNPVGRFVGTYNEEFLQRIIEHHEDDHYNFSLYKLREAWEKMQTQIDALKAYEKELQMHEEAEKSESEAKDIENQS